MAGGNPNILDPEAVRAIHKWAAGAPRLINTLADNALYEAYLAGRGRVAKDDVQRAAADLGLRDELEAPGPASELANERPAGALAGALPPSLGAAAPSHPAAADPGPEIGAEVAPALPVHGAGPDWSEATVVARAPGAALPASDPSALIDLEDEVSADSLGALVPGPEPGPFADLAEEAAKLDPRKSPDDITPESVSAEPEPAFGLGAADQGHPAAAVGNPSAVDAPVEIEFGIGDLADEPPSARPPAPEGPIDEEELDSLFEGLLDEG